MGTVPIPLEVPQDEILGQEDIIQESELIDDEPPEVDLGEDAPPEVDLGIDALPEIEGDEPPEVDLLPQVIGEEDFPEYDFPVEPFKAPEQDPITYGIKKISSAAGSALSKGFEALGVPYRVGTAATFAYQQGFTSEEVAEIGWNAATDLERINNPSLRDVIYMATSQAGNSPQIAKEVANSPAAYMTDFAGEALGDLSNLFGPIGKIGAIQRAMTKWAVRAPFKVTAAMPKTLINASFSMPKPLYERYVKRYDEIERTSRFFKPRNAGDTEFDEYASRLSEAYQDLRDSNIIAATNAPNLLREGFEGGELRDILIDGLNELGTTVGEEADAVSRRFGKLINQIERESVREQVDATVYEHVTGITKDFDFDPDHIVDPKTIRSIIRGVRADIDKINMEGRGETEITKFLSRVQNKIDQRLKKIDANSAYKEAMLGIAEDTERIIETGKGLGIISKGTEDLKLNGKKFESYGNTIMAEDRSKREGDKKLRKALDNMEILLKKHPELEGDFFTSDDVIRDLASSSMIKRPTTQGSKKVNAFSFLAGGLASLANAPYALFQGIGAMSGLITDTHGREMAGWVINKFMKEELTHNRWIVRPLKGVAKITEDASANLMQAVGAGVMNTMTRRFLDDDIEMFDMDTGVITISDGPSIEKAMNYVRKSQTIKTIDKMKILTSWTRDAVAGGIKLHLAPTSAQKKGKPEGMSMVVDGKEKPVPYQFPKDMYDNFINKKGKK